MFIFIVVFHVFGYGGLRTPPLSSPRARPRDAARR
jgi:hypothetical protein